MSRSAYQKDDFHAVTQMKQHNEADIWLHELPYRVKHHMQSTHYFFGFIPLGVCGQTNRKSQWRTIVVYVACFLLCITGVTRMWQSCALAVFGNEIAQRVLASSKNLKLMAPDDVAKIFTDPDLDLRDFVYYEERSDRRPLDDEANDNNADVSLEAEAADLSEARVSYSSTPLRPKGNRSTRSSGGSGVNRGLGKLARVNVA